MQGTNRFALGGVLAVGTAVLLGCGDKPVTIDETLANDQLDWVDEGIPGCDAPASSTARRVVTPSSPDRALADVAMLLARARDRMAALPMAGIGSNGSCGGTLAVESDHANGDTKWDVTFDAFCATMADGDVVLDGAIKGFEDGTPSDTGPVVDSLTLDTKGDLEITSAGESILFNLSGFKTVYGNPQAGSPGIPDASNPNVTTIRSASTTYVDHDSREEYVQDVRIERTGSTTATLTITDGIAGTAGIGRVDIRTAAGDPIVLDIGAGRVTGGTIEMTGADDTVATIAASDVTAGVIELTVNGSAFDRNADCSAARAPVVEIATGLLLALPIQ